MPSKLLLGQSPWLEMASEDWALVEPETAMHLLPIKLDKHYGYELDDLARYSSDDDLTAFVAWGPEFLNFQRLEVMGELKKRGFKMPALVHPRAIVSPSARFQENVWVQALATIGPQVRVGLNACVGRGANLGAFSQIGNSVWIGEDAYLSAWVTVGANAIVGQRVQVAERVRIGRQGCIEVAQRIDSDWPEKAFHILASDLQGRIIDTGARSQ